MVKYTLDLLQRVEADMINICPIVFVIFAVIIFFCARSESKNENRVM